MDRIIEIKVGGNYLSKDNKNAGVRGEANVTQLRITFDEGWDGFAKKVTFWDARGGNPVERTLTTDLLEDITKSTRIYLVPIPAEPMAEAGTLTFVIDGYIDGKRQRSIADSLEVKDSPIAESAEEPADPTPTQAEQLQVQIESIMEEIKGAVEAKEDIENMSVSAEALETGEPVFVKKTEKDGVVNLHFGLPKGNTGKNAYEIAVEHGFEGSETEWNEAVNKSRTAAEKSAEDAEKYAAQAKDAVGKTSYISENGYWYAWDGEKGEFYYTGIKAQAGSTIYYGDNPPPEADVWINPEGESSIYAPYIGENGHWYTFDHLTQTFTDSGVKAALTEEQLKNIEKVSDIEERLEASIEHIGAVEGVATNNASAIDGLAGDVEELQTDIADLNNRVYRLISKITVEEDVASVTISKDNEGNSFKLTDFEIRITGLHSTTLWIGLGKSEKYFSLNQIANNVGLPVYNSASYYKKNIIAKYIFSGTNYYGTLAYQGIGTYDSTNSKYNVGGGQMIPFNTTSVSSLANQIIVQAISGGVIKAGTVIEIWGY